MKKTKYNKSSIEIERLKKDLESKCGISVRTPADFNYLSGLVTGKTGDILSPTTLKRLWGYINGSDTIRHSTLNILAKYLDFKHWEDYLEHQINDNQSLIYLRTYDLKKGESLQLRWEPNRMIKVKHLNKYSFEVEEQENTVLQKGDVFSCCFFVLHEPLYIDQLIHGKEEPMKCVLGGCEGLTSIQLQV